MKHALQASLILIALAAIIAPPRAVAEPVPRRVVSINLCSDILALPLAAPGTVVSVFRLAVDPQDSPVAHLAQGLVLNDARAEEVLALHPDLVLAHQYNSPFIVAMLARARIRVVTIGDARSLDDIRANVRTIASALHREAQGEAWIAAFDATLAQSARPQTAQSPRAILYQDLGSAAAPNSILGALLRHTGFHNVIEQPTPVGLAYPDLENVIALHPQLMALGLYRVGEVSQASAVLNHPALVTYRQRYARTLDLDASQWTCGTPFVAGIAATLAKTHDAMLAEGQVP